MAFLFKLFTLLAVAAIFIQMTLALEFMDEDFLGNEDDHHLDEEFSAEVPRVLTGYTRDTIAHFNPRKADGGFRQLWERVPLQKGVDIKRR
ncbi:uncharacterized protein LOC26535018 [Drosophila yakuba]|uniref:Drosophila melanogaster n=1 Tax=Drosophila yakuba TaxID=7245 RepID=A0A0R1EBX5_DROYA|nr:uncharacterized protein LOC26535018 [Drosophila yakuba]KRK06735.1 uncharacterized protein Dyak_GE27837 [Drosophila yakuba]